MKVGLAQFNCQFGQKEKNLKKIKTLAAKTKADLLVFPELALTGYLLKNKKELIAMAENIPTGPSTKVLAKIANLTDTVLIVGLPEKTKGKYYNSTVVVGPKGYITHYQKSHLFLREKKFFSPGTKKPTIFSWQNCRVGVGICYDYMFPEYWRTLALSGADIFCNTANFVFSYGFKLMQARALENGVFSICTNRTGKERGQQFTGGSEIVDNRGKVLYKADKGEAVKVMNLDLKKARNKKWNKYNDLLKDRRPKLYRL